MVLQCAQESHAVLIVFLHSGTDGCLRTGQSPHDRTYSLLVQRVYFAAES